MQERTVPNLILYFRLEKLSLQTTPGKVKIIGIVMGMGGAMVFNLYRGKEINVWSTHVDLLHTHGEPEPHTASHRSSQSLLWGCMLSLGGCVSYSLWFIVQVRFLYFLCFRISCFFLLFIMYFYFINAGKSDKEFPLSLLKHSSSVPDGINSICNFRPLRGEGLEAMEVGTFGFIFGR